MHLENIFLAFSYCLAERNGKSSKEQNIFNFLYIWDSLVALHLSKVFFSFLNKVELGSL